MRHTHAGRTSRSSEREPAAFEIMSQKHSYLRLMNPPSNSARKPAAAPLLCGGPARVLAHGHRSASRRLGSRSGDGCSALVRQSALRAQAFQTLVRNQ